MRPVGEVPGACDAPAGVRSAHATMHTAGPANATPCRTFAGLWIQANNILLLQHLSSMAYKTLRAYLSKLADICDSPALGDQAVCNWPDKWCHSSHC